LNPNYIGKIPIEPTPADGTCKSDGTQGSNSYYWVATNSGTLTNTYTITFCLGAATGGYSAGPHTLTPSGIHNQIKKFGMSYPMPPAKGIS